MHPIQGVPSVQMIMIQKYANLFTFLPPITLFFYAYLLYLILHIPCGVVTTRHQILAV